MRRQRSLIGALITRFALVAGLGIVGTLFVHALFTPVDLHYELDAIAQRLQSHLRRDADGHIRVAVDRGLEQELGYVPGLQLQVVDVGIPRVLLSFGTPTGDDNGKTSDLDEMGEWPPGHFELFDDEANRRAYGYVTRLEAPGGADIRMVARRGPAQTRDVVYWLRTELLAELGPYVLVATLVAVGIAVLTVLQALAPLNRLSAQALAIVPGAAATRLDEEGVPREVLPLVCAVNDTLDRLHRALAQERRFTASAAHELRTPLAAVQARLDALDDGSESLALRRSVSRMTRIVDQLLAVARLESGQVALSDTVDLDEVSRHAVAERAPLALTAEKSIELTPASRPTRVCGNAMALEQALGNLIDNALAVSPPGGTIEVEVTDDGRILVADRGPGFGNLDPALLFEPFARGRGARRARDGAGLGLAIVRDTALLHGGVSSPRPDRAVVPFSASPFPSCRSDACRKVVARRPRYHRRRSIHSQRSRRMKRFLLASATLAFLASGPAFAAEPQCSGKGTKLDHSQIAAQYKAQGWTIHNFKLAEHGCYEMYATRGKERKEITVDPWTGKELGQEG